MRLPSSKHWELLQLQCLAQNLGHTMRMPAVPEASSAASGAPAVQRVREIMQFLTAAPAMETLWGTVAPVLDVELRMTLRRIVRTDLQLVVVQG